MSELRLIEDMCAAVPAPGEARLSAMRARVLEKAVHEKAVLEKAVLDTTGQQARPVRRGRGHGGIRAHARPRLALAVAGAVTAAVAVTIASVIWPGGGAVTAPATAAVLLNRAATAALAQPVPTDKQLIYSDTTVYYATYPRGAGKPDGHVLVRQQEWQSLASPAAFYRTTPCDVNGDLQRGQASCDFHGGYGPGATPYGTYAGLMTLPLPASRLLAYLATLPAPVGYSRHDREWSGANLIASLNPVLPSRFGSALFRAVAQIPGTTLLPATTDAAGARGIVLARPTAGMRQELVFDPRTYRLIGEQDTALAHGGQAAYVTMATALIRARLVRTGPGTSAGSGSGSAPGNGKFIYTDIKIIVRYPSASRAGLAPRVTLLAGSEQIWQSVDGSKPGAFESIPCHAGGGACLLLIPPGSVAPVLTYAGLATLPTTPAALSSYLRRHGTCPSTVRDGAQTVRAAWSTREWNTVTAILGNTMVLPPRLGRALFETAAGIPAAVVLRAVTDAAGGHGIAVALNQAQRWRTELIFAPRTYQFIGVQVVLTRRLAGMRAGTVLAASALASAKIVNTAPVTALGQSYQPSACGYMPGSYAVGSSSQSGSGPANP